jgi:CheY-like chemotaxis protein
VEVARVPGEAELRIRFEVRDTGIGIEHERVSELFEPFVQAEAGTTREFGGTGLGLTISRDLTELMGGSIAAEGRLGDGSTFSCELPFEPVGALVATPVPDPGLAGIRALVADPSATTRRTLVAYASAWGMRASDCASAPAAIEALRVAAAAGEPYGVVLLDRELDLQLPAGPGDPPVILLSTSAAWPSPDTHGRLTKPVRRTALLNAISTAVGLGEPALDSVQRRDSQPEVAARRAGLGARPGVTEDERPLRVLVAEDHDVNWLVIERMLASRGHRAVRARDGHAVLELASEGVYDLALMDIQMPGRDGFDTARELRRRELGPLPIVAMTASAMTGTREACLAAGMDDYVTKPISSGVLDEILGHWCVPGAGARPADTPLAGTRRADLRLDPTRLDQLRRLLPASEMRLRIDEMAGDVDRDLRQLATAVAAQDQARAAEAAHRIRNTGRLIGAEELVVAAAAFDHPPRPDRPAVTLDPDALELLNASWVETREALAGAIASLPATQA